MRQIFGSSIGAAVVVSALIFSLPAAAQSADTTFAQKTFSIFTWDDPPTDPDSYNIAQQAHFNLLVGPEFVGDYASNDSRLALAASFGLKALTFTDYTAYYSRFDPATALAATTHYTNLDDTRRGAMYGYFVIDEPCDDLQPNCCPHFQNSSLTCESVPLNVRNWVSWYKTHDPSKLAYVNLAPYYDAFCLPAGGNQCNPSKAVYEAYLDRYLNDPDQTGNLDVASVDEYPFKCEDSINNVKCSFDGSYY